MSNEEFLKTVSQFLLEYPDGTREPAKIVIEIDQVFQLAERLDSATTKWTVVRKTTTE